MSQFLMLHDFASFPSSHKGSISCDSLEFSLNDLSPPSSSCISFLREKRREKRRETTLYVHLVLSCFWTCLSSFPHFSLLLLLFPRLTLSFFDLVSVSSSVSSSVLDCFSFLRVSSSRFSLFLSLSSNNSCFIAFLFSLHHLFLCWFLHLFRLFLQSDLSFSVSCSSINCFIRL